MPRPTLRRRRCNAVPTTAAGLVACLALAAAAILLAPSPAHCSWLCKTVDVSAEADYSAPDLSETDWTPVPLPDRDWDARGRYRSACGWYRYHFTPDPAFSGRDMVLKLGIVDDVDCTYCNGVQIGQTGAFPPQASSAYNVDREYLIPAGVLRYGEDNVLAVKVYDMGGIGGLLGSPRLGYRLSEQEQWLFQAAGKDGEADYSEPALDDGTWATAPMPDDEWDKRQPQDGVYGWYRLHFTVPEAWRERALVLDLGLALDVDQGFVNGTPIGGAGEFPPRVRTAAGEPRLYALPPECLNWDEDNVLAVKVYNHSGRGGLWGRPAVLFGGGEGTDPILESLAIARRLRLAGKHAEAWQAMAGLWEQTEGKAQRPALLSELTVLYEASGQDADAVETFTRLLREHPADSPSREAALALGRVQERLGGLSETASYLGEDRRTKGNWWLSYGTDAFVLCLAGGDCDLFGRPGSLCFSDAMHGKDALHGEPPLTYYARTSEPDSWMTLGWISAPVTDDPRATYNPVTRRGLLAWWDDGGQTHPSDDAGPDILLRTVIPDGLWRLALYLVDADWGGTWRPREHAIVLGTREGELLAVGDTGKFGQGCWQQFCVRGPIEAEVRVLKGKSPSAVLSAFALDRMDGPAPPEGLDLPAEQAQAAVAAPPANACRAREDYLARQSAAEAEAPAQNLLEAWVLLHAAGDTVAAPETIRRRLQEYLGLLRQSRQGEAIWSVLERQAAACREAGDLRAAQLLDRAWAQEVTVGQAAPEATAKLTERVRDWLALDDAFAGSLFDLQLESAAALPAEQAAAAIAALGTPYLEQGRELRPSVRRVGQTYVEAASREGGLLRPAVIPSLAQRAVDRLRAMPQAAGCPACRQLAMTWCRELLGGALETPGGPDAQIAELDRAADDSLGIADARADVLKTKVWVLAKADRLAEAMEVADEFWALEPTIPLLKGFVGTVLGEALARAGRVDEAAVSYRRALDACEGHEQWYADTARRALEEIEKLKAAG